MWVILHIALGLVIWVLPTIQYSSSLNPPHPHTPPLPHTHTEWGRILSFLARIVLRISSGTFFLILHRIYPLSTISNLFVLTYVYQISNISFFLYSGGMIVNDSRYILDLKIVNWRWFPANYYYVLWVFLQMDHKESVTLEACS